MEKDPGVEIVNFKEDDIMESAATGDQKYFILKDWLREFISNPVDYDLTETFVINDQPVNPIGIRPIVPYPHGYANLCIE
jgi:hypothetical protein